MSSMFLSQVGRHLSQFIVPSRTGTIKQLSCFKLIHLDNSSLWRPAGVTPPDSVLLQCGNQFKRLPCQARCIDFETEPAAGRVTAGATLAEAPFPSAPNQSLGDPIFFFPRKSIRAIVLYLSSLTRFSSC